MAFFAQKCGFYIFQYDFGGENYSFQYNLSGINYTFQCFFVEICVLVHYNELFSTF